MIINREIFEFKIKENDQGRVIWEKQIGNILLNIRYNIFNKRHIYMKFLHILTCKSSKVCCLNPIVGGKKKRVKKGEQECTKIK